MLRHMVQELLNIEQLYEKQFNNIKSTNFRKIEAKLLVMLETIDEWDFFKVIS
jgi:hypothetical protein